MMQSSFVASNYEELRQLKHIVQCDRQQLERLSVIINFLLFSQFLPGYGLINHFFRGKLSLPNRYQGNGENAQSYKGSSGGNWVLLIPTLSLTKNLLAHQSLLLPQLPKSKIRRQQYMSQKQYWKQCFFLHDNCMIETAVLHQKQGISKLLLNVQQRGRICKNECLFSQFALF